MRANEFLTKAVLEIVGSGVFGKPNFHFKEEWTRDIVSAARDLLYYVSDKGYIDDEPSEPDKPP